MKFSIAKAPFYKSLSSVSRAASSHSPMPILSGIKFELSESSLTLIASDYSLSIKEEILIDEDNELKIFSAGELVLESRYILEAVRKLDSEIIEIEVVDGALTRISGTSTEYMINGIKGVEYPHINFETQGHHFKISAYKLAEIITQTAFACSASEDRPVFTGVNFKTDGEQLNCVATDSYRLAKKTFELQEEADFNITVPARNLFEVLKTIDKNEDVDISVTDREIRFIVGKSVLQSRLVDGLFPDVNRLIPTEFAFQLTINTQDLINAIDRSSFLKSDGYWTVKLEANNEKVIISSRSQEIGSSQEEIVPIDYIGGNLKISFSGKYMIDALKSFKTDEIIISFVGEMQAFILRNPHDHSVVQLILPVRTFD